MRMDKVAGSGNDEFYTPRYAIEPLLKYLPPASNIWCPFDTEESLFIPVLTQAGHTVQVSHLESGGDFFKLAKSPKLPKFDVVVSNPPYSLKADVFEELFALGIPFAMIVGVVGLFESQRRFELFRDNKFEIMYLNRRVSYFKSYQDEKPALNPPFSSVWITSNLLPQQIVFEEIKK
jgi:hypothetical protein